MQRPRFPRPDGWARQDEMAPVPLAGPVVSPWPLAEGGCEIRRGCGVGRIYKCVNNFAVVEGSGAPRQQKPCEGHCGVLYLSVRTPPKSQVSIFNQDQSPSRGSPAVAPNGAEAHVDIAELKRKSVAELHAMAESLNITNYSGLRKQDLIFRIEQSLLDSDTVLRGEGVLEILPEGYGFLRSADWNYLYGPDDIYVSPSQIKRFDLRTGDTITGQVRPPKEGERYLALLKVEVVNGEEPEKAKHRVAFDNLRPRYPEQKIGLERKDGDLSMRVMDILSPIGKGQRGLIVSPPKAGKTILMQKLANSIIENHPEIYLIVLLIDERPEEVTDMEENVKGPNVEVVSSTFDEPADRHVQVADVVIFEEFKGTGNSEVILDRRIAERRTFPSIDVQRTSTRKEELLLTKEELNKVYLLRNFLSDMPPVEAIEFLLERLKRTKTNTEFFQTMSQG